MHKYMKSVRLWLQRIKQASPIPNNGISILYHLVEGNVRIFAGGDTIIITAEKSAGSER